MSDLRITVTVRRDGSVDARRRDTDAVVEGGRVAYEGLDADLVGLFERWLTLRDRTWREDEVRAFGALLHRCLFPGPLWSWVENAVDAADAAATGVRLELAFPADPPWSRLAAVPWEYLYRPSTPASNGWFLALRPGMVLSRYVPDARGEVPFAPEDSLHVLVVVSQPDDQRLGPVLYEEVVQSIDEATATMGATVAYLANPTAAQLHDAVQPREGRRPHLVHFMGHGEFDPAKGAGAVALTGTDGTDWVDDTRLADLLRGRSRPPRAVVLHSCEGARADFGASFAGVAPQMVRSGVQSVVAMQYAVTNETAIRFSRALYQGLARGDDLDVAVQDARWDLTRLQAPADPRLIGLPVVYLQNRTALLSGSADGGTSP